MKLRPRTATLNWTFGFAVAAAAQGLAARRVARNTTWSYNGGWQREIAAWNLGTLAVIVGTRSPGSDIDVALNRAFAVLGTLFAVNHLHAAGHPGRRGVHLLSAAGNLAGVGGSLVALAGRRA